MDTIYLGGGTPSLIHPSMLERILNTVHKYVSVKADAEITAEMDPATFSLQKAVQFASLGVNRASVGAQSFDDNILSDCRRVHKARDIHTAIHNLRTANISNISLDLISALPHQSFQSWKSSLQQALRLNPNHISAYDLTLESGTLFHSKYSSGIDPLPDEQLAADMMLYTAQTLSNEGFDHYEVSNYAKGNSFRSKHNLAYWRNNPFYAFGLGATSLVDGYRFARPRRVSDYEAYVEHLENALETRPSPDYSSVLYPHIPQQTSSERLEDYLINAFRLLDQGVLLDDVEAQFGSIVRCRIQKAVHNNSQLEQQRLVHVVHHGDCVHSIRLTEQGALLENSILATLMQDAVWNYS